MTCAYLFHALNKLLPRDAIISEECPSSKGDLDRYVEARRARLVLFRAHRNPRDSACPPRSACKWRIPNRRVVCAVGDGSAQYSIQALWSAVQSKAPVIFVVICNGNYSALKGFRDFTQVGNNVPGIDIPGIDAVKIAQGYGMQAHAVERPEDLGESAQVRVRIQRPSPDQRNSPARRPENHGHGPVREPAELWMSHVCAVTKKPKKTTTRRRRRFLLDR